MAKFASCGPQEQSDIDSEHQLDELLDYADGVEQSLHLRRSKTQPKWHAGCLREEVRHAARAVKQLEQHSTRQVAKRHTQAKIRDFDIKADLLDRAAPYQPFRKLLPTPSHLRRPCQERTSWRRKLQRQVEAHLNERFRSSSRRRHGHQLELWVQIANEQSERLEVLRERLELATLRANELVQMNQPRNAIATLEAEKDPTPQHVLQRIQLEWGSCLGLYVHGSTLFSNKAPEDVDILAVVNEPTLRDVPNGRGSQFKLGKYEVSVYTRSKWLRKMAEMDITMLTNASLPSRFILYECDPMLRSVSICPSKLFESVLAYANFTWVKACSLLQVQDDARRAKKNVNFVFRILELGGQLMDTGRISNFYAANHWWSWIDHLFTELSVGSGDWEIVEAALASSVQSELHRFREKFQARVSACLPPSLRGGMLGDWFKRSLDSFLGIPTIAEQPLANCHCLDTCGLCEQPLGSHYASAVVLIRCNHVFHGSCAAHEIRMARRENSSARCWTCRRPLHLGLDKKALSKGTPLPRSWVQRPYGGYPATVLLPEELGEPSKEDFAGPSARSLIFELMRG
mmetsp:Transcript_2188/g.6610  ORF Transcript_2188/g.6610 Transcript_2188/m.6610 type:complete len:572 (+) Transcript_2188:72-1787(+)